MTMNVNSVELFGEPKVWLVGAGLSCGVIPTVSDIFQAFLNHLDPQLWADSISPAARLLASNGRSVLVDLEKKSGFPLRFEEFAQYLHEYWDPQLTFVDEWFDDQGGYLSSHLALCKAIEQGHRVFTTNFDGCIENAWSVLFPQQPQLKVIADDDGFLCWNRCPEPVLFKLHGSRILSGRPAKHTIETTLDSVGVYTEAHDGLCFNLSDPKRDVFSAALKQLPLVVAGYSG